MNKLKLFLLNFLVYGFGGIISKVIPLIMVPIITRIMPNSSFFGINDMSNTVVQFGSALAIMGMYDAMYRMFFEKEDEDYRKNICSTAFAFTLATSILVFFVMILCKGFISEKFFGNSQYTNLVYITAIATMVGTTNSIVSAPTRMQNKSKVFLVMNMLSPILCYSIAIPLLLRGHYIVALPIAMMVANITYEIIFICINRKWFNLQKVNFSYLRPLLMIGIPLLPNFLIYWIFNSSDKLMITNMIGTSATGIYSVGAKLGNASQLIYTAFAGGWQFFAFSTMKEENQVKTNSLIFEYLGIISFICTTFVFALSYPIYELLFEGEYVSGYIIAPYLFLAPLLQMLFQVSANQFLIVKKTWPNMFILSFGAIVNIILNLYLIPVIGIEGAAIATLFGYVASDVICVVVLCKMQLQVVRKQFVVSTLIMLIFILVWRFITMDSIIISVIMAVGCSVIFALLYKNDIKKMKNAMRKFK